MCKIYLLAAIVSDCALPLAFSFTEDHIIESLRGTIMWDLYQSGALWIEEVEARENVVENLVSIDSYIEMFYAPVEG